MRRRESQSYYYVLSSLLGPFDLQYTVCVGDCYSQQLKEPAWTKPHTVATGSRGVDSREQSPKVESQEELLTFTKGK